MLRKFVMHLYEYDTFAVHMQQLIGDYVFSLVCLLFLAYIYPLQIYIAWM